MGCKGSKVRILSRRPMHSKGLGSREPSPFLIFATEVTWRACHDNVRWLVAGSQRVTKLQPQPPVRYSQQRAANWCLPIYKACTHRYRASENSHFSHTAPKTPSPQYNCELSSIMNPHSKATHFKISKIDLSHIEMKSIQITEPLKQNHLAI